MTVDVSTLLNTMVETIQNSVQNSLQVEIYLYENTKCNTKVKLEYIPWRNQMLDLHHARNKSRQFINK